MHIQDWDRDKVISEMSDCQSRILQILVPTLVSVGLISVADREHFAIITIICAFSVLFYSSFYSASLSYKIFRNASFIRALSERKGATTSFNWEAALAKFNSTKSAPRVLGYETKTLATVYLVFVLSFVFMFIDIETVLSLVLGVILVVVAVRIYLIPGYADKYLSNWKEVMSEFQREESEHAAIESPPSRTP